MKWARALLVANLLTVGCPAPPTSWTEPVTGIEFVRLPAGEFEMGSPESEVGHEAGERRHRVRLTHALDFGRYEVTQGQWRRVMGANPSRFADCGPDCPVENVNALEIAEFLVRLRRLSGGTFRLPTEAEWEYACRAGSSTPFGTGAKLSSAQANYDGRYPYAGSPPGGFAAQTTPVGSYPANAWGLFDLHGNVSEWTLDQYEPDAYSRLQGNPSPGTWVRSTRPYPHVVRGGNWSDPAELLRSAARRGSSPDWKMLDPQLPKSIWYHTSAPWIGFRVVRPVELPSAEEMARSWNNGVALDE